MSSRNALVCFCVAIGLGLGCSKPPTAQDEFGRVSREGKKQYEAGASSQAVAAFEQAVALRPNDRDAHLNLANACLANNQPDDALAQAAEALRLDNTSAAAHYLMGCAHLRLGQAEQAIQSLQQAKDLDPTMNAVSFQLGRAHQLMGQFEAAATQLEEVVLFEPDHPAAHYALSQVYRRLGQDQGAATELAEHQRISAEQGGPVTDPARYERCRYTRIVVPFKLQEPSRPGVPVRFVVANDAFIESGAESYRGPAAALDLNHDGLPELFLREAELGFRLLSNLNGVLRPVGNVIPAPEQHSKLLVGDLNNDLVEDVICLNRQGARLFKFDTNGVATDLSRFSKLDGITGTNGVLIDVDYSGTLDLLMLGPEGFKALRNVAPSPGNPYFLDYTTNFVGAAQWSSASDVVVEDWDRDDLLDVIVARAGHEPLLVGRQRQGLFASTNAFAGWPEARWVATGDLNNDSFPDLVLATADEIVCSFSGLKRRERFSFPAASALQLVDYDNDGWLDILAAGPGVKAWRNAGSAGFVDVTQTLGLDTLGPAQSLLAADLDGDCDADLVVTLADGQIRLLRNEGGNANHALKLRLIGTKSNASGLGIRIEVTAEGLHLNRRVNQVPVLLGVGANREIESLAVHWFDFTLATVDLKAESCDLFTLQELGKQDGSCPYLYAWDGQGYRFVTDLLGAAPLGLPASETRLIPADPREYVWIGAEHQFPPKDGEFVLQVTEELREVLYLDEAKLVVVDHPAQTELHTTGKLRPSPPFPQAELLTLNNLRPLRQALDDAGHDVTAQLRDADQQVVSPLQLRSPQLSGLAEPFAVTLDFGPLDAERSLVLAITAWLRFGGGTVNVAASLDPDLPFPFPVLEVERATGEWDPVDVVVGAPAGKTKNWVVDLTGKLPRQSRRLRLRTAFEIHWDRIALLERTDSAASQVHTIQPTGTDLHWRGFGADLDLPWFLPPAPDYERVYNRPLWRWTPAGWCTRYGAVDELVRAEDNALVILNGGDELTLRFAADQLPPKPSGFVRDFFFYSVGWDKDANVHVVRGRDVEPLPWHGMDDQRYGQQTRPTFPNDDWIKRYNTRWVGPRTLARFMRPPGAGAPP